MQNSEYFQNIKIAAARGGLSGVYIYIYIYIDIFFFFSHVCVFLAISIVILCAFVCILSKGFAPAAGPPSNRPDGCKISDPGGTKNGDLRGLEAPF